MPKLNPTIALVAGEVSGDMLGASLIKKLKSHYPHAKFVGIGGELMQAQGLKSWVSMEEIAVMGLVEILRHLPRLLRIRREIVKHLLTLKPDIFIGIDAPEFNLYVERKLKEQGIKTIHYVSPSVWAWRQKRIHHIAKATDLVLAFLPFEKAFYDKFNVPCQFVGHSMADQIPLIRQRALACEALGLDENGQYLAILVGSRRAEVARLTEPFLKTACLLKQAFPHLQFVVPLVNQARWQQFNAIKAKVAPDLPMIILEGKARLAMQVAQVTLLASGTASLEAMLCKSPMVVGYKMNKLTYFLAKWLVKTPYISLPNLLAGEALVPELIQADCCPKALARELCIYLQNNEACQQLETRFYDLHQKIRCGADERSAQAVKDLLEAK